MSVEQNFSSSANANGSGYGCCCDEWENPRQSPAASLAQDDAEQGLPQYYLPCAD